MGFGGLLISGVWLLSGLCFWVWCLVLVPVCSGYLLIL